MRSIHTTKQNKYNNKNNTPYRVIHKHRTKLGSPIWGIIILAISIISLPLLSIFSTYADGSVSLSVNNSDTVLELTIPESISLNLTPSSVNSYTSFGVVDLNILAGTNNPSGYTLTMKADSDALTRTGGIIDGSGATPIISPLSLAGSSTGYSLEDYRSNTYNNYTLNTWGYKKSTNTNFIPAPITDIELASTDAPGNATPTILNFTAKVDSSIPAGTYNTTLNFNIVGNVPAPTYKHEIVFNEHTFGRNDNCTMNIYTTFPEQFNAGPIYINPEKIDSILYAETNNQVWTIGFESQGLPSQPSPSQPSPSQPSPSQPSPSQPSPDPQGTTRVTFDSIPTLIIDREESQQTGYLNFILTGTIYGVEKSYFLINVDIVSDTVTLVE